MLNSPFVDVTGLLSLLKSAFHHTKSCDVYQNNAETEEHLNHKAQWRKGDERRKQYSGCFECLGYHSHTRIYVLKLVELLSCKEIIPEAGSSCKCDDL